ncbi:MAG: cell division protein ZapA [Kiloniellales bacterium]
MAQVSVNINRREYRIACDDGEEQHLSELASYIDQRVGDLVQAVGQIGDTRLMVMASLLIADELADANAEIDQLRAGQATGGTEPGEMDAVAADIEALAERIDALAARLADA